MNTVPIWPRFVRPALEVLAEHESMRRRDVIEAAADRLQLSEEARAETVESGEVRYRGRGSWALTHSSKAGLIERPARGIYVLTESGRAWLKDHPEGFNDFAGASAFFDPFWSKGTAKKPVQAYANTEAQSFVESAVASDPIVDPEEEAQDAVTSLNETVRVELLERLQNSTPTFFEEAVVQLLMAMGYGGTQGKAAVTGKSYDGGIDGVIDGDALGLDRVYVQAKRYADANTVGREPIQAFVGALRLHGATKGVFIATSSFSKHAQAYADAVPDRIVLIDGVKLTQLMLKYRVGAQVKKTLHVLQVDEDFFD
ncbi:restriction endonuclease [Micrococcus luteus]|uniref:restriction endonuclease n=1 Tax=Micrococcus TaxID=1269 RepID=UPI00055C8D04|nr:MULTISPECIES: restriction endonuclease [Micrococcus]OOL31573.1 hypothetical protein GQ85_12810 [Rhodococcus rhodochrous]MCV7568992.1 restriction endonuclease [Micrococcus luteus]MCV7655252.1 restriction endonuclease [Micrococcus luteus]MCV7658077.1 restriction endonuclease [Micrococcus luteus]MDN3468867.1 restriction endonuclease [Micrococcus sp. APC 4021]